MTSTNFCYFNCSLCLKAVDQRETTSYHVFFMNDGTNKICPDGVSPSISLKKSLSEETYPRLNYSRRLWVLHQPCRDIIKYMPPEMLGSLLDLVEPTFLDVWNASPVSLEGGFTHNIPSSTCKRKEPSTLAECQPLSPSLHEKFPPEIWDMIQQYDIGRLLFVMKVAAQLEKSALRPAFIPNDRLITGKFLLTSNILRIHLTTLGNRTYISRLEDATVVGKIPLPGSLESMRSWQPSILPMKVIANIKKMLKMRYKDSIINDEKYLAIKSDGVGIVDLAFRRFNKKPDWILNTTTRPFEAEIAEIRHADISRLTVISDSLKCRAIIPANRSGAEPFFYKQPLPPPESWVDSGFSSNWRLERGYSRWKPDNPLPQPRDPMEYIAKAEYIPIAETTTLVLEFKDLVCGQSAFRVPCVLKYLYWISDIKDSKESRLSRAESGSSTYTIHFSRPPTKVKFLIAFGCHDHIYSKEERMIVQFDIEGRWEPRLHFNEGVNYHETVVENILGIWIAATFPKCPPHIGVVVSNKDDLKNTYLLTEAVNNI